MTPPRRSILVGATFACAILLAGNASAQQVLVAAPARGGANTVEVKVANENLTEPGESPYALSHRAHLACRETARSFRARNSTSPTARRLAFEACTASARRPQIARK